jgi:hypothetical protein
MTDIQQIRQGDILLVRVREPTRRELATGDDGLPLAGVRIEGERTGHAHVLNAEVYDIPRGRRAVLLRDDGVLTHEEHSDVIVPAGWWEIRIQREWVPSSRPHSRPRWD